MKESPFIVGRPVTGDEFVNREGLLSSVFNRIRLGQSTIIWGVSNSGKSSIQEQIGDRDVQKRYLRAVDLRRLRFSYVNLHTFTEDYGVEDFWEDAFSSLESKPGHKKIKDQVYEAKLSRYAPREVNRLFKLLQRQNRILVLLLDNFEYLLDHKHFRSDNFFSLFRSYCNSTGGLAHVITTKFYKRDLTQQGETLGKLYPDFFSYISEYEIASFSKADAEDLLDRASPNFSESEKIFIQRIAGKDPYLLQVFADILYKNRKRFTEDAIGRAVSDLYQQTNVSDKFLAIWQNISDEMRAVLVLLTVRTLWEYQYDRPFDFGTAKITKAIRTGIAKLDRLKVIYRRKKAEALPQKLDADEIMSIIDAWNIDSEAFVWWIRDNVLGMGQPEPMILWRTEVQFPIILSNDLKNKIIGGLGKLNMDIVADEAKTARSIWVSIRNKAI